MAEKLTEAQMTDFDRKVLAEIANPGSQKDPVEWGAGKGDALTYLRACGYVTRGPNVNITDKGRKALEESE